MTLETGDEPHEMLYHAPSSQTLEPYRPTTSQDLASGLTRVPSSMGGRNI